MTDSGQSMRVEPLQYEQIVGGHIWPELFKSMGLVAMLYGVALVCSAITYLLRLSGFIGPWGSITQLTIYVIPNLTMGIAWIVASIGVLNKSASGISAMRIILMGFLVATVLVSALGFIVTGASAMVYQAAASAVSALLQSALPLLCLAIIRIYRRTAQPG